VAQTSGMGISRMESGRCDVVCLVDRGISENIHEYRPSFSSHYEVAVMDVG